MSYRSIPRQLLSMAIVLTATLLAGWSLTRRNEPDALVVFCSRESPVANAFAAEFEQRSGVRCLVVTDPLPTEGWIANRIARGTPPRCDVLWDTSPLDAVRLAAVGELVPLSPAALSRIPEAFRGPQQTWAAFAGVRQVWWSPKGDPETMRKQVEAIHAGEDLSGVSIVIDGGSPRFAAWAIEAASGGPDVLGERLRDWGTRGAKVSMKSVSGIPDSDLAGTPLLLTFTNVVAERSGTGPRGFVASYLDGGRPVAIPNVVAIHRQTDRPELAQRFAAFLLSEVIEVRLVKAGLGDVPVGRIHAMDVPEDVRPLWDEPEPPLPVAALTAAGIHSLGKDRPDPAEAPSK